jgi:hypothetical protein
MRAPAAVLALALLATSSAAAQNFWRENGVPIKHPPPNLASDDPFAVEQIATADPDQLMSNWAKPTPGVVIPAATTTTPRNKPLVTFIIFSGCKADSAGNCNVTADFLTTGPAGQVYDDTKAAEVWVGKPPPPGYNLQLSAGGLGIVFEEKDPLGAYVVRATITDHVSGKVLHTQQTLTVTAR